METIVTVRTATAIIIESDDTFKLCSPLSRGSHVGFKPDIRQQLGQSVAWRVREPLQQIGQVAEWINPMPFATGCHAEQYRRSHSGDCRRCRLAPPPHHRQPDGAEGEQHDRGGFGDDCCNKPALRRNVVAGCTVEPPYDRVAGNARRKSIFPI
jgi:hypothetical protein